MGKARMAALAALLGLAACSGGDSPASSQAGPGADAPRTIDTAATAAVGLEPLPQGAWTDLARALVAARDLDGSVDATREILARGGIATTDGERILTAAIGPASHLQASPGETVGLAMQARHRAHAGALTISELAQMLETLGWPFPDADPEGDAQGVPDFIAPEDADGYRALLDAERESAQEIERNARRMAIEAEDAAREAAAAADRQRVKAIQDATLAWQEARQAASKAPPAEREAAAAAVQAALAARQAAIEARNRARKESTEARDRMRASGVAGIERKYLAERIQRRIGPDHRQGERVMAMLGDWVRDAAANPDDPESFTPLFLAEMARLQDTPVDLLGSHLARPGRGKGAEVDLRGAPRAQQLRWTLLEIELFAAAFDRRAGNAPPRRSMATRVADVLLPPAHAASACDDFKAWLDSQTEGFGGDVANTAGGIATGAVIDAAAGTIMDATTQEAFGRAMSALGMVAKLAKLAAFYGNEQATVTPEPVSAHKPVGDMKLVWFTARAGISAEEWAEYQRAMGDAAAIDRSARDCLEMAGLPRFNDAVDVAKEAEKWWIVWRLTDGGGNHVYINYKASKFDQGGRFAMRMKRESESTAAARLGVDIRPERGHTGTVARAYATAEARVDAAGMPSPSSLIAGLFGGPTGLADVLLELLTGWYQEMNMPKAYGTMEIEYHCPRPGRLHRSTGREVADGGGDPGPDNCLLSAGK